MKSKLLIYILPLFLISFLIYGYNTMDQNPDFNINAPVVKVSPTIITDYSTTASWTTLTPSPHAQSRSTCAYIMRNDTGYIYQFGGGSGALLMNVARFNLVTNSWTNNVSTMPQNISAGGTAVYGDSVIFVFGGQSATAGTIVGRTLKYNIVTNTWTEMALIPSGVTDALVAKYRDTLVYVVGGGDGLFGATTLQRNTVQIYNIKSNTYSSGGTLPIPLSMMGGGIYKDTIMVFAGASTGGTYVANSYKGVINPTTLQVTWTPIPNYPTGNVTRMASYVCTIPGQGVGIACTGGAIAGATLTAATNFWNMCTQSWQTLPNNSQPRSNFRGTGAGNNIMYVVGGFTTVGVGTFERLTFTQIDGDCSSPPNPGFNFIESFEGTTFPPAGWGKLNPDGGTGWNRQTVGTSPLPGWTGGVITAPPGGGNAVAYCTWNTGGSSSNDQWLYTPQISNFTASDSLAFWMKRTYDAYLDQIQVRLSTTTPTVAGFSNVLLTKNYAANNGDTLWTRYALPLAPYVGQNIYVAWREIVANNFTDGAAISLDLVSITGPVTNIAGNEIPVSYSLSQNYPNPFNPVTTIKYSIAAETVVSLKIFDITGREVAVLVNSPKMAGSYEISFDASHLSSGIYFYKLQAGNFNDVKRMVLVK